MPIRPRPNGSRLAGFGELWTVIALLCSVLPSRAQEIVPVVPLPRSIDWTASRFPLDPGNTAIHVSGDDRAKHAQAVIELEELFEQLSLGSSSSDENARLSIRMGIPAEDGGFETIARDSGIWPQDSLGEEGYSMSVDTLDIVIAANTTAGVYYGVQTLKQLVRAYHRDRMLPGLRIVDWPDLKFRAVSDDISRGPVPTPAYMRAQIDRMAEMKYNALTYYTEHVVKTESHPEFAPAHGSLDIDEWRDLAAYARERHITLLGNFQSFGHFERILEHPMYTPLGEAGRVLSPVLPESRALLRDIYSEMVPAFDADVFVVNGDETFDLGRGPSKARADSVGIGIVYAEHMINIHNMLDSLGVGMVMWGDVLLQHEDALAMIPRDVVIGTWDYTPRDSYDHLIAPFTEKGFRTIVCSGVLNSSRVMPDFAVAKDNIRLLVSDGVRHGVLGLLNTVWDDGGSALFGRDWYGVAYAADHGWYSRRAPAKDANFDRRFSLGHYGDPNQGLVRSIHHLNQLASLEPTDGMTEKVLWAQLVPQRGSSLSISLTDWDHVIESVDSASAALANGLPVTREDDFPYFSFTADLYRHLATIRYDLLAAAAAYRSAGFVERSDPARAKALLKDAMAAVIRSQSSTGEIRRKYEAMWLSENRQYALDWTTDRFDDQEAQLEDVVHRLDRAMRGYDRGDLLPPPTEVRLAISESKGRYFREWLMSGVLPNEKDGAWGASVDYLASMGGEMAVVPGVADEWEYEGNTYRWHRNETPYHAEVNLAELYPDDTRYKALYAFATITAPRTMRVRATVGSNDSIKIILNGQTAFENSVKRALMVDDDEVWLELNEGRNNLMLKISQGTGGWGFSFGLPDVTVRSSKNRYRIVE